MFLKRSYESEIMDDFSIQDQRLSEALAELRVINNLLGGNSVSLAGIKDILKNKVRQNGKIKVLDLGAGSSDTMISANLNLKLLKVFGLDINLGSCKFIKKYSPKFQPVCADALNVPFKENAFDVSHASLFFHHLTQEQIQNVIKSLLKISRFGLVINDLRRSVFAYIGIKILTTLFSSSVMVKNDAPLSVRRGFTKSDLLSILANLNIRKFKIKRKWAFRWLIIIYN